jgi:hypothetical protein
MMHVKLPRPATVYGLAAWWIVCAFTLIVLLTYVLSRLFFGEDRGYVAFTVGLLIMTWLHGWVTGVARLGLVVKRELVLVGPAEQPELSAEARARLLNTDAPRRRCAYRGEPPPDISIRKLGNDE